MIIPLGTKNARKHKKWKWFISLLWTLFPRSFQGFTGSVMQPVSSQWQCVNPLPLLLGCIHCFSTWAHFVGFKKHEQARCCLSRRNIFTNKMKCMLLRRFSHNKALSVKYLPSSSSLRHGAQVSWCGTPSSLRSDPKAPSTPYLPLLATISFLFQQNWFFWNQMNRHALSLIALTAPAPRGFLRQAFVWQAGTEAWLISPFLSSSPNP